MTYKELLFKMAHKGMLTLSNDKDGRGLFWAGMNNLEALSKEFDWRDLEIIMNGFDSSSSGFHDFMKI